MIWFAIGGGIGILLVPVMVIMAYVVGHRQGMEEAEKQHAHELEIRRESMRKRTVTSSSVDNDGHARVKSARIRRG